MRKIILFFCIFFCIFFISVGDSYAEKFFEEGGSGFTDLSDGTGGTFDTIDGVGSSVSGFIGDVRGREKQRGLKGARTSLQSVGQDIDGKYRKTNSRQQLFGFIENVIKAALGFIGTILLVVIVYAGYTWLMAGGNQDKVMESKKWIVNGVIGTIIISLAWLITSFVFQSLKVDQGDAEDLVLEIMNIYKA